MLKKKKTYFQDFQLFQDRIVNTHAVEISCHTYADNPLRIRHPDTSPKELPCALMGPRDLIVYHNNHTKYNCVY